jgi:hypothetical protein
MVGKIATGEAEETKPSPKAKGAKARAAKLTKAQRADIARVAAEARWKKS